MNLSYTLESSGGFENAAGPLRELNGVQPGHQDFFLLKAPQEITVHSRLRTTGLRPQNLAICVAVMMHIDCRYVGRFVQGVVFCSLLSNEMHQYLYSLTLQAHSCSIFFNFCLKFAKEPSLPYEVDFGFTSSASAEARGAA